MKNNKNRLCYYIILIIITCTVGLFSYYNVTAKDCDFSMNRTCDFGVGKFIVGKKKCKDIKTSRIYTISYNNLNDEEVTEYGFCYYDPEKKGFFYEIVSENCNRNGNAAFIYEHSHNANLLVTKNLSESVSVHAKNGKLTKEDGCAPYLYYYNKTNKYTFSYEEFIFDKEDDIEVTPGKTVEDNGKVLENITSCVGNGITSGKNCNDDGTLKDLESLQRECVEKYVINFTDELYKEYDTAIKNYYREQNMAENFVLICKLSKKCNAKPLEIVNYIGAKSNNSVLSLETLIKESFSPEVQKCVNEEVITKADEVDAETQSTEDDFQNGTTSGLDGSRQRRDDADPYLGERLRLGYGGQIDPGNDCDAILSDETTKLFNTVLRYMQYLGPVLVVVLSTMDFIKAAASGNPDDMKKAWNKLVKRLIAAILLFFVSLITRLLLSFFDITVPENCIK